VPGIPGILRSSQISLSPFNHPEAALRSAKESSMNRPLRIPFAALLCAFALAVHAHICCAQQPAGAMQPLLVPAALVSDIHFEPFWDPDKALKLASLTPDKWHAALDGAPSANRAQRYSVLQQRCYVRGSDTSFPLFQSSLSALRAHAAGVRFITVSGDLLSHQFDCRYGVLFGSMKGYRDYVENTIKFVLLELNSIAPGVPVFAALGNNDSDCGDYLLDANSTFLADIGTEITKAAPAPERSDALTTFSEGGYYSASLPGPMQNAHLLVLEDLFYSHDYLGKCPGSSSDPAAAAALQLKWLAKQVNDARNATPKQNLWVMGHIPTGFDARNTLYKTSGNCVNPSPFLSSDSLFDALDDSGDVVKLAIFAHTHMDEIRLIQAETGSQTGSGGTGAARPAAKAAANAVPMKMVPSISPVNGNYPSFTIAQIDPDTATVVNYQVIAAKDKSGAGTWTGGYDYHKDYGEVSFSADAVAHLLSNFAADPKFKNDASRNYIHNFSAGGGGAWLENENDWSGYVCIESHNTAAGFNACDCPGH